MGAKSGGGSSGGDDHGGGGGGGVACGSSLSRVAAAADEAAAHDVWARLTLRAQVFHREDSAAAAKVCTTVNATNCCDNVNFRLVEEYHFPSSA